MLRRTHYKMSSGAPAFVVVQLQGAGSARGNASVGHLSLVSRPTIHRQRMAKDEYKRTQREFTQNRAADPKRIDWRYATIDKVLKRIAKVCNSFASGFPIRASMT